MNYIGGIDGMNFKPIAGYNSYLKNNAAFEVNSGVDFENVLNKQTEAINQNLQNQQNPMQIQGGVEMSTNFNDLAAQTAIQAAQGSSGASSGNAGDLINSLASSVNGGLNSVNQATDAANKAQEAFAMGEDISVHDVMIASEKASLSLQMALQLRNKLLSAYTEINNVRV